jgi:hypothetical protein
MQRRGHEPTSPTTPKESTMDDLSAGVQSLLDHREIENVITTYPRAVDRGDVEMLKSCFHSDALSINSLGEFNAHEFFGTLLPMMHRLFSGTMHHVTHSNIRIDGGSAVAESYFIAYHAVIGGHKEVAEFFGPPYAEAMAASHRLEGGHFYLACGRYLDRLEKRAGIWRFAVRKVSIEWSQFGPTPLATPDSLVGRIPEVARRDSQDPVYELFNLRSL